MCQVEDRILDATIKLLAREGYDGATTRKIAEEAGINEVTIFRRFKNKENLVKAARLRSINDSLRNMDKMFEMEDSDFQAYMTSLGKNLLNAIDDKTNFILISIAELQWVPASQRPMPKFSTAFIEHLARYFEEQMAKGKMRNVNPRVAAIVFHSYVFYMSFMWKVNGLDPAANDERSFQEFMDIFMNGVLMPANGTEPSE